MFFYVLFSDLYSFGVFLDNVLIICKDFCKYYFVVLEVLDIEFICFLNSFFFVEWCDIVVIFIGDNGIIC